MKTGTYRERVHWPFWFHLIMGAVLAIGGAGLAGLVLRRGADWGALVPLAALAAVAIVWWRVRYLALEFGAEGAAFGFGGLHRRVPRGRLESAAAEAYSVSRYMGWGYRMGWGKGDRAYSIIGYRRGVRLVFEDEQGRRWRIFVSSGDPEAALAALEA